MTCVWIVRGLGVFEGLPELGEYSISMARPISVSFPAASGFCRNAAAASPSRSRTNVALVIYGHVVDIGGVEVGGPDLGQDRRAHAVETSAAPAIVRGPR